MKILVVGIKDGRIAEGYIHSIIQSFPDDELSFPVPNPTLELNAYFDCSFQRDDMSLGQWGYWYNWCDLVIICINDPIPATVAQLYGKPYICMGWGHEGALGSIYYNYEDKYESDINNHNQCVLPNPLYSVEPSEDDHYWHKDGLKDWKDRPVIGVSADVTHELVDILTRASKILDCEILFIPENERQKERIIEKNPFRTFTFCDNYGSDDKKDRIYELMGLFTGIDLFVTDNLMGIYANCPVVGFGDVRFNQEDCFTNTMLYEKICSTWYNRHLIEREDLSENTYGDVIRQWL